MTLNSDDPGLFAITLSGELDLARARMGFSDGMIRQSTRNALEASFVDHATKTDLLERTPEWR